MARVRARLRRTDEPAPEMLQIGDIVIDVAGHSVKRDGETLNLTPAGVRPARRAGPQAAAGLHPRGAARAGVGLPARGRHAAGQRPRTAAARQDRAGSRASRDRRDGTRRRLQGGSWLSAEPGHEAGSVEQDAAGTDRPQDWITTLRPDAVSARRSRRRLPVGVMRWLLIRDAGGGGTSSAQVRSRWHRSLQLRVVVHHAGAVRAGHRRARLLPGRSRSRPGCSASAEKAARDQARRGRTLRARPAERVRPQSRQQFAAESDMLSHRQDPAAAGQREPGSYLVFVSADQHPRRPSVSGWASATSTSPRPSRGH